MPMLELADARVACFGSRETPERVLKLMTELGSFLADNGAYVVSGHCEGADLAFQRGGWAVDPGRVVVCLPWNSYNSSIPIASGTQVLSLDRLSSSERDFLYSEAQKFHGAWGRLTRGGQALQARNMMIGLQAMTGKAPGFGICYLNHKKPGFGGSGQAHRFLSSRNLPVYDLAVPAQENLLMEALGL
jgi:hypothetical protein